MEWLSQLFTDTGSVAHAALILGLVAALGLAFGTIRVFGISLGVAGVLFAGLAFGHFGLSISHEVMDFAREFGLILFVYTVGVQVGPGFLASLKKQGLPLNLMAAAIVFLGVATTLLVFHFGMARSEFPAAVGLFSGATTNTPSLAASQQALKDVLPATDTESAKLPGLGYAVAYPFGIIGIIVTMLLIKSVFKIDPQKEGEILARMNGSENDKLGTIHLEVQNPDLIGMPLGRVPELGASGVVVSRVLHNNQSVLAHRDTILEQGDVLLAVGPPKILEQLVDIVGEESPLDIRKVPGEITTSRIVVTKSPVLGKTVSSLDSGRRYGVKITRLHRAEVELPITDAVKLQFGDSLVVVGEEAGIEKLAEELGNSPKRLNHPQLIPIFVGIALGVLLGSWPINLPGFPAPVKLGLAGGPLLVAIILSRIGKIGPLNWYMPISANFMLREVGIVLFLSCVGLKAGDRFVATLLQGHGLSWMAYGSLITFVPLMLVGLFARIVYKLNYLSLCGLLAGSMTDPPALAFAGTVTGSDAPHISYATVYPLVMLLRVLSAQAMVLFFFG